MTNRLYLTANEVSPSLSPGGAYGPIEVRWMILSKNHWRVIVAPGLSPSVKAGWGSSFGDVSFDPLTKTCEIRLVSCHGNTWNFVDQAHNAEDARQAWTDRIQQADFNPLLVMGFDTPSQGANGLDNLNATGRAHVRYETEWCDRLGYAINDFTMWDGRKTNRSMNPREYLGKLSDQLDDLSRRGFFQTSSLETDRIYALHKHAKKLLAQAHLGGINPAFITKSAARNNQPRLSGQQATHH